MLITDKFVFRFGYEDAIALLRSAYGKDWQKEVAGKRAFYFKKNTFLAIYPSELKMKDYQKYFESFMLGFVFLNGVDSNRYNSAQTSSTMVGLVKKTCLAVSEAMELPLKLFFEGIDETELGNRFINRVDRINGIAETHGINGTNIYLSEIDWVLHDYWVKIGMDTINEFIQNGFFNIEKFDPTLIGEELIEGQNDFIIKPTDLFINSLDQFKIEKF